jgi:hypothetical protein
MFAGAAMALTAWGPAPPAAAVINPGSIAGTVTDLAGDPIAGISVSVLHNTGYGEVVVGQGVTDATGGYRVDDIAADPYYKLRFTDPDAQYATEFYDDNVASTFATWVPVSHDTVTEGADAALEPAASVAGQLTIGAGAPVPNGVVTVWWQYGQSAFTPVDTYVADDDGNYVIEGLKGATYALQFRDPVSGASEYWNDRDGLFASTPLVVSSGAALTGIDALLGGVVQNATAPTIAGVAQQGQPLAALRGSWVPDSATVTYRWVVGDDSTPGDDPTGATYTPTAADVGKTIRVHATGTNGAGWVPAAAWSAPTAAVLAAPAATVPTPPTMTVVRLPRIKGIVRVDSVVRVTTGEWSPYPQSLRYQWFAKGKPIKKATHRRFRLTDKQLGKRLFVRVTAAAPGHTPVSVTTARTARVRR